MTRQTMSNWLIWTASQLLTPVYNQLRKELLTRDMLHADETTLQVLREPGKTPQSKSYMWLHRTSGDTDRPITLYEYQPDRKGERPKEYLTGFRGYLYTDGHPGYHDLSEDITVVSVNFVTAQYPPALAEGLESEIILPKLKKLYRSFLR